MDKNKIQNLFKISIVLSRLIKKNSGLVDLDRSIRDASEKTNFWYILYTSLMTYIIYNKLKKKKRHSPNI